MRIRDILAAAVVAALPFSFAQATILGFDNGETNSYLSFSQSDDPIADGWSPGDWFGWGARGAWPQGAGMPFALADDSTFDVSGNGSGSPFPNDTQGIVDTTWGLDDQFFGVVDTINGNNPDGQATATWTFDISGFDDIKVGADFAAMGDFEASNDVFRFTYSIDGSPAQIFWDFVVEESLSQSYTMEDGDVVNQNDPLSLNGVLLNDLLQTFVSTIDGTGSVLTIEFFEIMTDGGSEAFLFDNLTIYASEPGLPALLGAGLVAFGLARRRKA